MRLAKPLPRTRRGFSLIELLVVIAIIAILASMIIGASMRTIAVQAQKNTQTLVQKLYSAIEAQWRATIEQANNEALPPQLQAMIQAGNDPRVIRANYINMRLAQQFPMNYTEAAISPDGAGGTIVPPDPFYVAKLGTANMAAPQQVQSGVLLWLMLSNSRGGASFNQDNLTPREAMNVTLGIPVGGNLSCVVDDWQQPLQFQRVQYTQLYPNQTNQALQVGSIPFDLPPQFLQLYIVPYLWSAGPTPNVFTPAITSNTLGG